MIQLMRALVRPVVTVGIVAAQIGFIAAGLVAGDYTGAKEMAPFTGIVLTYWFMDRALKRAGETDKNGGA